MMNTTCIVFLVNQLSILSVIDENGTKVFDASYDAWGKQTVTLNTIGLLRGYTGHEMLNEFNLINMNGRVYDPVLGRFLSPDKYVQEADNSQNYNSYSYCLNNPLKYTDPSGNVFVIDDALIVGVVAGAMMGAVNAKMSGKSALKGALLGGLSALATYGIGQWLGAAGSIGHELARAGLHGLSSGLYNLANHENFWDGFLSGAAASGVGSLAESIDMSPLMTFSSTTIMGGVTSWASGGSFIEGAMHGALIGSLNHLQHQMRNFSDKQLKRINDAYKEIANLSVPELYEKIGGPLGEWAAREDFTFSCAARVSYALNYGGMPIPKGTKNTYLGGDGKSYFINAKQMKEYFTKKWGHGIPSRRTKIINGIIYQTGFPNPNVSGHIDIVYRRYTYGHYYEGSNITTTLWH